MHRADKRPSEWKDGHYQHGQILRVRDLLLVLCEPGEVVLVEAGPDRPNRVLGRFPALEGTTWNTIALSGPYLLVRNAREAACYRLPLAARGSPSPSRKDGDPPEHAGKQQDNPAEQRNEPTR